MLLERIADRVAERTQKPISPIRAGASINELQILIEKRKRTLQGGVLVSSVIRAQAILLKSAGIREPKPQDFLKTGSQNQAVEVVADVVSPSVDINKPVAALKLEIPEPPLFEAPKVVKDKPIKISSIKPPQIATPPRVIDELVLSSIPPPEIVQATQEPLRWPEEIAEEVAFARVESAPALTPKQAVLMEQYEGYFGTSGKIYNRLYRMLGDSEDARDATMEVFARAYTKIDNTGDDLKLNAWLFTIATNHANDLLRRKGVIGFEQFDPLYHDRAEEIDFEIQADRADNIKRVRAALQDVSPAGRTALLLFEDGKSCGEIGEVIGRSRSAVKSLLFRAREQLRDACLRQGLVAGSA